MVMVGPGEAVTVGVTATTGIVPIGVVGAVLGVAVGTTGGLVGALIVGVGV